MESHAKIGEPIIEPDLPIVDPHHHLWLLPPATLATMQRPENFIPVVRNMARYLFDDFLADVKTGHNIRATVFTECISMYRAEGPPAYRSLGEVEFANGAAAMAASGIFGDTKICAGIIGYADLRLGDAVEEVLRAHILAGGGRYRGIRNMAHYDSDPEILGSWAAHPPHALLDKKLHSGFKWLPKLGLSFDTYVLEPQLPDVIELARTFPETQIILDHLGAPLGVASYADKRKERFPIWRDNMRALSKCNNVSVKLGGLGLPFPGFPSFRSTPRATSEQLAGEWKPYIDTCIEAFGANRCMFESNYPNDSGSCTYPVLWNAFKRLTAGASKAEKTALFSGTAARVYRIDI